MVLAYKSIHESCDVTTPLFTHAFVYTLLHELFIFQAHQNVTSTYLYVYDNDHLIDYPMERTYVNVHQNQEAIIPCRPTNSDVKMTFFRGKTEDISNVLESNLMRYEATTGLTVLSGAMQFHSSQITCRAQLGSKIQDYHFILEFHEDFGHILPTPNIFPSTPLHLVVGEKLKLVCQIDFYDENPDVDLIWDLEGKRQRADIGNLQRRIDPMQRGHLIVSKALTVDPIQETDEGGYTCYTVSNSDSASKGNETVYTIKHIRKHDREAHISNVVFQGHPEIVRDSKRPRNLGFPIKWIFDVFATPDPQYLWIGPNGHEISHDTLEKYEFDVDETNHRIKLIINDLQLSDMGHYVFTIEVDNDAQDARPLVKDIDMYLKVAADPVVTLTAEFEKKLYLYQHSYEYTCRVEGYPIDEQSLQWTFHPCLDYGACNETVNVSPDLYSKLKPIDDLQNTNDHYNFSSILIVSAETSGIYRCKVCSEAATSSSICSQDETRVLISDYSQDGFTIVGPEVPNDIIEGDIVELTCAASIYTYDQVVWFKEKPKKLATDDKWEKLPPGITMDNRRSNFSVKENPKKLATEDKWKGLDLYPGIKMDRITKFSVISTITYPNVIIAEGGNFQCRAVLKNDTMDVVVDKEIEVVVLTPIKPSWSKTFGMNGTTISREQGHDREILDCSAHGRPPPVITWTKDGKSFPNVDTENTSSIQMAKDNSSIIFQVALPIHSGKYECSASNRAGTITGKAKFEVIEPIVFPGWVIALIVIGCTVIIILGIVLAWRVRVYNEKYKQLTAQELNMFENGDPGSINPELGVDDQADLLPYNKSYEFPRESLKLGKQLGSGAFGRVLKAQAIGINAWERSSTVAVKMVKPNADVMYVRALMSELKIMIHLGRHMNIVNLLGASTKCLARKELFVIVEYCRFGNLQKYLLQHRYHFISQVDPITGNIDFNIGQDAIDGYGNDFARAREEEEMSAAYLRPNNTNQDGYLMPNESVEQQQQKPTRNKSVRYVANPGDKRQRTISIQSDCNRIVSTDMTTLPEEEEESDSTNNEINPAGTTRPGVERSQSTKSEGGPGPGWRANMKGDYDVTTVKPISTKDLLCWAYQVRSD
jgi:FMS-like tyrosine kinase 1